MESPRRPYVNVAVCKMGGIPQVGAARVLVSFNTEKGLCQPISVESEEGATRRFVGCLQNLDWRIALSVSDDAGDGFVPASELSTEMIDLYLDMVGAGAALDPESEAKALEGK